MPRSCDENSDQEEDKTVANLKLIEEISKRPALYNYQLPIGQRNKKIRDLLWDECAQELHTTVYDCQRRYKNLRDTYNLYRQSHPKLLKKWTYTSSLSFLENVRQRKKKSSEILEFADEESDTKALQSSQQMQLDDKIENFHDDDDDWSTESEKFQKKRSRKRSKKCKERKSKKQTTNDDDSSIATNENEVQPKDEIDLFLEFLNKKIRKLPLQDINEIQRKFLEIVLDKERNLKSD